MRPSGVRITTERQLETLAQQPVRYARQPVGGSAARMIRFEIVGVYGDSAEVDVLGVQCGGSIPESYDETVTVYDALGCLLVGEDEEALIGVRGYATRIRDVASGECRWEIISLCCPSGD